MNIEDMNDDLSGLMGDDFYEVVVLVLDSVMKQTAGDDEIIALYEILFQSMFENALLYNYIVSAGLLKSPNDVLKMKADIEKHINRIAEKRAKMVQGSVEDEEVEEPVWSMDQMKDFMDGKKI